MIAYPNGSIFGVEGQKCERRIRIYHLRRDGDFQERTGEIINFRCI